MKIFILISSLVLSINIFAQKDYGFDIPWRAKSNERIFEWFIDNLDPTCDTVVLKLFNHVGVNTDSIQWIYPTQIPEEITKNGDGYYSLNRYHSDNQSKKIKMVHVYDGTNKLPNKVYSLFYTFPNSEGKINFVLSEYY
jgi:hypothetical protein